MEPEVAESFDEFYQRYGQQLASRTALVAHSEENPAFVFVEDQGDPKDVLDFISSGKFTGTRFLIWENFQEDLDSGGRDNYHSAVVGSMLIMQKGMDKSDRHRAVRECRQALLKAFSIMLQDNLEGELEARTISVDVRDLPCEKLTGMAANWHGYGMQFRWSVPADLDLQDGDVLPLPERSLP